MIQKETQTKMLVDKTGTFYNRSMKSWQKKMTMKCIQHKMKENLLLLKYLLEL